VKNKAIYSGTFDPFTKGHLDILKQSLKIFDTVIIAVAVSSAKKPMFDIQTRVKLIQKVVKKYKNVKVIAFDSLLVDFVKKHNVSNIIRGVRDIKDFEYEKQISYANLSLNDTVQTVFFLTKQKHSHISSSLVRELVSFDGEYKHLLPKQISKLI
jgi:pantetheine-phosphate adenylyltransferase